MQVVGTLQEELTDYPLLVYSYIARGMVWVTPGMLPGRMMVSRVSHQRAPKVREACKVAFVNVFHAGADGTYQQGKADHRRGNDRPLG